MSQHQVVQLRKKGGIETIEVNKNGGKISPKLFLKSDKKRTGDGRLDGDYKGQILNTRQFRTPTFSARKRAWDFNGTEKDLARLIKDCKLRYPKDHRESGKIIEPENVGLRLTDIADPFFTHRYWYTQFFMTNGQMSLSTSSPHQEFVIRCQQGNPDVIDKSEEDKVSKYIRAGASIEMVSPETVGIQAKNDADKDLEAMELFIAMKNDETKIRLVCTAMKLPGYSPSMSLNEAFVQLKDLGAMNHARNAKEKRTWQDTFISNASLSNADLELKVLIILGTKRAFLRFRTNYVDFQGEKLAGITTEKQLIQYFDSPDNQSHYLKLYDLVYGSTVQKTSTKSARKSSKSSK